MDFCHHCCYTGFNISTNDWAGMTHKQNDSWLSRLTTKGKVIIVLVVLFVVVAVGVLVYSAIFSGTYIDSKGRSYSAQQIRKELAAKNETDRKSDAASMAYEALQSDDRKKANVIYEQAIAAEKDPTAKVKLAIDRSSQLYSGGHYDDALAVAKQAESYSDDKFLVSSWLGQLYEVGKKYTLAADYYSRSAKLSTSPTNQSGFTKKFYEDRATSMLTLASKS